MTPDPLRTRAIVVGIERYDVGASWALDGPASDACLFAKWLHGRGVPKENILPVVSPLPVNEAQVEADLTGFPTRREATAEKVRSLLVGLQHETSDLLILYWGGHGVLDGSTRRLVLADATQVDKRTLSLTAWLDQLRTSNYRGHPRQLVLVDACLNDMAALKWRGIVSADDPHGGDIDLNRNQFSMFAASPGERAKNLDAIKSGLYSRELREAITWPIDPPALSSRLRTRFEELRQQGKATQTPSQMWYRARGEEDTQIYHGSPLSLEPHERSPGQVFLTDDEVEELLAILRGGRQPASLWPLFRDATRLTVRQPGPAVLDLPGYLIELRRLVDTRPLFEFALRYSADQDEALVSQVDEWLVRVAPRWGVKVDELVRLRRRTTSSVLLVKVTRDLLQPGWQVAAWSYAGGHVRPVYASDEPVGRERLAALLEAQVQPWVDDFKLTTGSSQMIVEFLLPMELLDLDVETIEVAIGDGRYEIGRVCAVVVRSLDRIVEEDWRDPWWDKWDELNRSGDAYDDGSICWIQAGELSAGQLGVCAALAYAYSVERADILRAALAAGTPVAVWHRNSPRRMGRKHALRAVLSNGGLLDLPKVVLAQRIAATKAKPGAVHNGRDLVLLWDDPRRVPGELDWQEPMSEVFAP